MQTVNNISFGSRIVSNKLLKEAFTEFEQRTYGKGRYGKKVTHRFCRSLDALIKDGSNNTYEIAKVPEGHDLCIVNRTSENPYPCIPAYADYQEGSQVGNAMRFLFERLNSHRGTDVDLDTPLFLRWKDINSRLQTLKTTIFGG